MNYHFDEQVNRRHTNSLKWEISESELPMWVADMDFKTAPEIQEEIKKRAEHGIYGYTIVPDEWYQAVSSWWEKRHNFRMEKEWLMFTTGVIPAISSIIRKLTSIGENVVIQSPVYHMFYNAILNNGRNVIENPLIYNHGKYSMDFENLERKLADPQTTMMILCNPHNPVGKIWDKEVLNRIGELCRLHHVLVIADEIHCDLTDPGSAYLPFASVSESCRENSITCIAPTKTFNLAGIQTAAVMVSDQNLHHKVKRALETDGAAEPNAFAVDAAIAAYTKGGLWLDELRQYLYDNKQFVIDYMKEAGLKIKPVPSDATYLLWIDCEELAGGTVQLAEFLRKEAGLYLSDGGQFGKNGENFLRMNIACPREMLRNGLERLKKGVSAYEQLVLTLK